MQYLKKYFARITLFTVMAFLSLMAIIAVAANRQPIEIKSEILYHLFIATLLFTGIDVLLKQVLKLKTIPLWIIQILLLLVAVYIWIISE